MELETLDCLAGVCEVVHIVSDTNASVRSGWDGSVCVKVAEEVCGGFADVVVRAGAHPVREIHLHRD